MFEPGEIKTFKISNGALRGESLPTRLKILNRGDNDTIDGVYHVGEKTSAQLSVNQSRLGFDRVAIDFNHCTVPGTDTHKELIAAGQPPLIFGYGRVNLAPDGIWLEDISWTPLGQQHARNFEDLSPALKDDSREVTMIHSVALTPNGKVKNLQFFSSIINSTEKNMAKNLTYEELAPVVGLAADAKPEDVLARLGIISNLAMVLTIKDGKIASLSGLISDGKVIVLGDIPDRLKKIEEAANKGITTLSATIDGKVRTFSAEDLVTLITKVEGLESKFTASETAATDRLRDQVIVRFSADGKVPKKADGTAYTADELKKLPVETLQLLHANTPVTVALSARGNLSQTDAAKSKHRNEKGVVDLASVFDAENASGN